jgi:copper(I)-binding protein
MVMGLQQQLQQGEHVKGTLVFEKAGTLNIEFAVLPIGAMPMQMPGK